MIITAIHLVILTAFVLFLYRILGKEEPIAFGALLALKIVAGLVVGWTAFNLYDGGDTNYFFKYAKHISVLPLGEQVSILLGNDFKNLSKTPRTFFFIRILSIPTTLTGNSYWLSGIYFSLVSFLASWYFFICIKKNYPKLRLATLVALFVPSIIFWSSGVLKGALSNSALLVLVALVIHLYHHKSLKWWEIIIGVLSLIILYQLKHYLLISFMAFAGLLGAFLLVKKLKTKFKWVFFIGVILIMLVGVQKIHPYLTFKRVAWALYENHHTIRDKTPIKNQLDLVLQEATLFEIIKKAPHALYIGLTKPSFFDAVPFIAIIHQIENLFLLFLMGLSIILYIKYKPPTDWLLLGTGLAVLFIFLAIITLSTPNLGTLVRYRSAYLPFLFLVVSVLPLKYFLTDNK